MLIDSHCHLEYDYAPKDIETLLADAKAAGVEYLVTIGTDAASWPKVAKLSEQYEQVFHTVGMHPHESIDLTPLLLDTLTKAAAHPKCRAIGEIGLDYHYDHSPREVQRERLAEQLEIARKTRQPIVIHSREGEDDLLEQLKDHAAKLPAGVLPGVIHCFSGTRDFGKACLDLGFYISFSGILTFKKADELRECAREFPLERLLVETDSPYLAPIPYRGKKCEPSMVRLTAQKLAEVKGLPFEEVARVTTENARTLFRI
ncbi:MAG: TatD family hydrolase [Oligoflexia bacterium]|nr:TatD family hydrolase [Oligoflexia bacterium]